MPLNPLDNMPEDLRRQQNSSSEDVHGTSTEPKPKARPNSGSYTTKVAPNENQENAEISPINSLLKRAKGGTMSAITQAKAAASEIANVQNAAAYAQQPCTLAEIQARDAYIRALSDLTRALNKKKALLLELRYMHDQVDEKEKEGNIALRDSERFKKQYAAVLLQLKETNDQTSSAVLILRQHSTYQRNPSTPFMKRTDTSRVKARTMVDAAVQAMPLVKDGEDAFTKVGVALDLGDSEIQVSSTNIDPVNVNGSTTKPLAK